MQPFLPSQNILHKRRLEINKAITHGQKS